MYAGRVATAPWWSSHGEYTDGQTDGRMQRITLRFPLSAASVIRAPRTVSQKPVEAQLSHSDRATHFMNEKSVNSFKNACNRNFHHDMDTEADEFSVHQSHQRSPVMVPFDWPYTIFCWSSILAVSIFHRFRDIITYFLKFYEGHATLNHGGSYIMPALILIIDHSAHEIWSAWLHRCKDMIRAQNWNKLAPRGNNGRLFTADVYAKFKVTWHKNRTNI